MEKRVPAGLYDDAQVLYFKHEEWKKYMVKGMSNAEIGCELADAVSKAKFGIAADGSKFETSQDRSYSWLEYVIFDAAIGTEAAEAWQLYHDITT